MTREIEIFQKKPKKERHEPKIQIGRQNQP